jgi:hypothetical protein
MDGVKQYKTAGPFRAALEARLQARAQEEKTDLQRLRRQVAFDHSWHDYFPRDQREPIRGSSREDTRWSCGFALPERRKNRRCSPSHKRTGARTASSGQFIRTRSGPVGKRYGGESGHTVPFRNVRIQYRFAGRIHARTPQAGTALQGATQRGTMAQPSDRKTLPIS